MLKIQHVDDGLKFAPDHIALFDYGFAKMKEHGIYHGWSVIYGWYATEADKERLINYDEATTMFAAGHWLGSFYGMTAVMPDVQDLIIQFHVNLLNRVNPHTGLRYADDPALAFIELQNEENAFRSIRNYDARMNDAPTYQRLFYKRFADWLTARYGTREALAAAWGNALRVDESLEEANITPFPVWYQGKPNRRVADQTHFIYTTQRDYYQRFERAVRETGYKGQLIGSCWQAADWVGHLYNVLSDRDIGFIDRHNYNRANIQWPGVGLLSEDDTIADAPSLLISATARTVDRGTVFDGLSDRPLVAAPHRTGPVVLEPVVATIELKRQGPCRVFALDHGGRKASPPVELPVERTPDGCRFTLDGAAYKTHYYVAEFEAP